MGREMVARGKEGATDTGQHAVKYEGVRNLELYGEAEDCL